MKQLAAKKMPEGGNPTGSRKMYRKYTPGPDPLQALSSSLFWPKDALGQGISMCYKVMGGSAHGGSAWGYTLADGVVKPNGWRIRNIPKAGRTL